MIAGPNFASGSRYPSNWRRTPCEVPPAEAGTLRESATYQAILQEGEAKGERKATRVFLLRLGRSKFGAPDPAIVGAVNSIEDYLPLCRLEELRDRLLQVKSWQELLA